MCGLRDQAHVCLEGIVPSLKPIARDLCPPAFWKAAHYLKMWQQGKSTEPCGFRGRFINFDEAVAKGGAVLDAGLLKPQASMPEAANAFSAQQQRAAFAYLHSCVKLGRFPLSVLDFGGLSGEHYQTWMRLLPGSRPAWFIVEVPAVVEHFSRGGLLRYGTNVSDCPFKPELAMASGSLQYVDSPYSILAEIRRLEPSFIFLDRLSLADENADFCSVQDCPGRFYEDGVARSIPHWFLSRSKLLADMAASYKLIWTTPDAMDAASLDGAHYLPTYTALFFERKVTRS